ncbi:MAG TPA: ABC transporter permease [Bacteroidales bacterium]|nr:ABC transporter permease [Bacteroidales bacterium]
MLKKDFWDLVKVFVWRELKIKYAQTYLGIFWMLFPPLMALLVVSFFFGNLMKVSHEIPNYTLFAYVGMLSWFYFSYVVSFSSVSLLQNQEIVQKSPIPRIVFPLAKAICGILDLLIWFLLAFLLMLFFGLKPGFTFLLLPFILVLNFIAGFSIGIWIAAFSIRWRDIYQLVPYIIGFTMLITPVFYHANMVPENLKIFLYFNPIAGVIEWYRYLFVHTSMPIFEFIFGFIFSILLLFGGIYYFHKQESIMAERL